MIVTQVQGAQPPKRIVVNGAATPGPAKISVEEGI